MKESELGKKHQVPPLRYPGFPVDLDGVGGPHAPFLKRKAHTWPCLALRGRKSGFATVGVCDFLSSGVSLRLESSQEQLQTSIAGVLRLRAINSSVCDRSAKRFAQDDGFVGGLKYSWLDMRKHEKIEKGHRLSR
jgi:hypothetical protein